MHVCMDNTIDYRATYIYVVSIIYDNTDATCIYMNFKSCNAEAVNIMHVYLNSCDLIFSIVLIIIYTTINLNFIKCILYEVHHSIAYHDN